MTIHSQFKTTFYSVIHTYAIDSSSTIQAKAPVAASRNELQHRKHESELQSQITYLLELVKDAVSVCEIPVEEELIDYGEVVSGFREAREDFLHVTFGLLFNQTAQPREEPSLAGQAFEAAAVSVWTGPVSPRGGGDNKARWLWR